MLSIESQNYLLLNAPTLVCATLQRPFDARDESQIERLKTKFHLKKMVRSRQVHGVDIALVTKEMPEILGEYDGLMTAEKDVGLLVQHADCQGALFYDPVHEVIGVVHCGWRGSVQNIYAHFACKMRENFGTKAKDLIVAISPSLGPECAEFINYQKELPKNFYRFQIKPTYFDFWEITLHQLTSLGIPKEQIEIARECTYLNSKKYHSYRRDKSVSRQGSFIGMKS